MVRLKLNKSISIIVFLIYGQGLINACTGIRLQASDGSIIYARTLEFREKLDSEILFTPRNHTFVGYNPYPKRPAMKWSAKYAVIGANALGITAFLDGVNEKGLAGGIFYFPDYAQFQKTTPEESSQTLASWQLLTWILTTCATLSEVRQQLPHIKVTQSEVAGAIHPVHYIIHDMHGKSLVIEYTEDGLHMFDNQPGVITNSPGFNWHITNLRNYVNLSAINVPKIKLSHITLSSFGQGSGMLGLPGDFTPPSRFVRAFAFSESVEIPVAADQAIDTAFHVLNLFDIPKGVVRDENNSFNHTQWTSAINITAQKYYFHTYDNRQVFSIDLSRLKNMSHPRMITMNQKSAKIDISNKFSK